jgi:RNA polymerase sigma-70 factor (ECF subfamily)
MELQLEIKAILNGDLSAFAALVQRYQKPVFKFLIGMGIPKDQIEDLGQEVFLAVYRYLNTFDPAKSRLSTWIFSIAKNKAINFIRLKKVKSFFGFQNESLESEKSESDLEHRLQNQDQRRLIRQALETLPAPQKSVFVLFYYSDLSMEEIAAVENCSVGTVKSRLHRLKAEFKEKLNKEALL